MSDDITVVVLAAGASRRLGRPKQLLPWEGSTLLEHAVRTATGAALGPVLVVLGHEAERCRDALGGLLVTLVVHERWEEGIGSSIGAGVRAAAARAVCRSLILMTCDQPGVSAGHLAALAAAWRSSGADAVGSAYAGILGTPALFGRALFTALESLTADRGAKDLLDPGRRHVAVVPCPECAGDIDLESDYQAMRSRNRGQGTWPRWLDPEH